jgi:hypothetical protein
VRYAAEVIINDMHQYQLQILNRSIYEDLVEQAIAANVSSPTQDTCLPTHDSPRHPGVYISSVARSDHSYIDEAKMMER